MTFLAVNPYSYDATTHPCGTNFVHIAGATGFEEFHGGVPNGLKVTYYVNKKNIDATYGKNVGAQYIPICAGTFKVVNGVITPCTNYNDTTDTSGWPADETRQQRPLHRRGRPRDLPVRRSLLGHRPVVPGQDRSRRRSDDGLVGGQDHRRRHLPRLHDGGAAAVGLQGRRLEDR